MKFFCSVLLGAIISAFVFAPSAYAKDPDTAACDNITNWEGRVAGCTRLLNKKRWPAKTVGQIHLQRAQGYSRLGKHDLAIEDYTKAVDLIGGVDAYAGRANSLNALGQIERGLQDATKAIQLNPKNPYAFLTRGDAYSKVEKYEDAIADYGRVISINPKLAVGYAFRATAYGGLRQHERAFQDADKAVGLDPKNPLFQIHRAEVYARAGEYDRAIAEYNKIELSHPTAIDLHLGRATVYSQKGEYDLALADSDKAIRLNPKSYSAYMNRCVLLLSRNERDTDEALRDCNKAIEIDPELPNAYINRAAVWLKRGEYDRAIADADKAIRQRPNLVNPYLSRGDAWRSKGDLDRSAADFDRAIRLAPHTAGPYVYRGLLLEAKGDPVAAKKDFEKALTLPETANTGISFSNSRREQGIAKTRLALLNDADAQPHTAPKPNAAASPAALDRRIALVIGNAAYAGASPLTNPLNDARLIAKNLREIGFDVAEGTDLNRADMKRVINEFLRGAAGSKMAVVFYAGHGMQIDGRNYLMPVDVDLSGSENPAAQMTDVEFILTGLDDRIRTNIVVLDACRDNPMVKTTAVAEASRSVNMRSGLATPSGLGSGATLGAGTLLAFATAPGQVALDGDGGNSPFSTALGRHISTPGLEVQQMLTRVRSDVVSSTAGKQVPWSNSSLLGEVFLVGAKR